MHGFFQSLSWVAEQFAVVLRGPCFRTYYGGFHALSFGATAPSSVASCTEASSVDIDTWLVVVPQLIARIHMDIHPPSLTDSGNVPWPEISELLFKLGMAHPQSRVCRYCCSQLRIGEAQAGNASRVLSCLRQHSTLFFVTRPHAPATRRFVLPFSWHERWHQALEEACTQYFTEGDVRACLATLEPLHRQIETAEDTGLSDGKSLSM